MTTIYDIAKQVGVSPATVSRVINQSGYVSAKTRQRILEVLKAHNYYPNELARSLISKQSNTIALVVSDVTNPFFTTLARGVEDVAIKNGFSVVLCNTDENPEKESLYLELVLKKRMDGVILAPAGKFDQKLKLLGERKIPLVLVDRKLKRLKADVVCSDNVKGARLAVNHLVKLGHKRIAMITGPLHVTTSSERLEGYRAALQEHGVEIEERLIKEGRYNRESGYKLTEELLSLDSPPTAILAANNFLAIGAILALRARGLRVPEDMALISFDDVEVTSLIYPFMTAVVQSSYTMGTIAAQMLLERIEGKVSSESREVVLNVDLVVRQSCGVGLQKANLSIV